MYTLGAMKNVDSNYIAIQEIVVNTQENMKTSDESAHVYTLLSQLSYNL